MHKVIHMQNLFSTISYQILSKADQCLQNVVEIRIVC